MELNDYKVFELVPSEGHVLTQAADVPVKSRVVILKAYIMNEAEANNWKEITVEEGEIIKAERRRILDGEAELQQANLGLDIE